MQHDRATAESAGVGQVKLSATNTPAAMAGRSDGRFGCMCKRLRSDLVISSGHRVSLGSSWASVIRYGRKVLCSRANFDGAEQYRVVIGGEGQSSTNLRDPVLLRTRDGTRKVLICGMGKAATYF